MLARLIVLACGTGHVCDFIMIVPIARPVEARVVVYGTEEKSPGSTGTRKTSQSRKQQRFVS